MQDTELTPDLAKAIVQAPGQYRFFVPADRREAMRDVLRRASARGAVTTRTAGDTMWVSVT